MNLVMTEASDVSGRSYMTLLVLARYADDETGQCWPGMRAVSFMARQSVRTTVRAIEKLAQAGWIEVGKKAVGGCNRYTLDLDRLESESVRMARPRLPKCDPQPVQKPVEKLRKSCGQPMEKAADPQIQSANRGNEIIKEVLEKREIQRETEATPAGPIFPDLPVSRRSPDILATLKRLNRSIAAEARSRGAPPGSLPP